MRDIAALRELIHRFIRTIASPAPALLARDERFRSMLSRPDIPCIDLIACPLRNRLGLLQKVALALMVLLAMRVAVYAQSGSDPASGVEESSGTLSLGDTNPQRTPQHTFALEGTWIAARMKGSTSSIGVSKNTLSSRRSIALSNLCLEEAGCDVSSSSEISPAAEAPFARFGEMRDGDSKNQPPVESAEHSKLDDFNRDIYYKNKLEFSLDGGWLPINIPWPFDIFMGDGYYTSGLNYTLVPIIGSLRWHLDDVGGPWILRGNWDMTFSASVTAIPRGPETRYFAYLMGFRRNFVRPRWRAVPYFNAMGGLGQIDAKGPLGVYAAQGQNFTFTLNMGSGVRYNFNPRYAISGGINYMHISNFYLSEPKFLNYGINVYGPMFGLDIQLRPHRRAE